MGIIPPKVLGVYGKDNKLFVMDENGERSINLYSLDKEEVKKKAHENQF